MKIFLNLLAGTTGGQVTRARAFLDRFEKFMPNAQLIVVKEEHVLCEYVSTSARTVINVAIRNGRFKAIRRMWWENAVMPGLIRKYSADVYLTFSHYLPQWNKISVPSVVGVSNLAPFSEEAWAHESLSVKLRMAALKRTIISSTKRADSVLALSDTCRRLLVEHGVPRENIIVTPNGVDEFWEGQSSHTGIISRLGIVRPYLLYVSHFYRYKNHFKLVEAYARISPNMRGKHQLVLVGKPYDKVYYNEVLLLIGQLGLSHDVLLIPGESSDHLRELYQSAKLFLFPSLIENSPNILLEAMMAGAPVIACDLPPMPEFCGRATEYFDALDVSGMAEKIEAVLGDSSHLANLSRQSRTQADKFTWDAFVLNVAEKIQLVCNQSEI